MGTGESGGEPPHSKYVSLVGELVELAGCGWARRGLRRGGVAGWPQRMPRQASAGAGVVNGGGRKRWRATALQIRFRGWEACGALRGAGGRGGIYAAEAWRDGRSGCRGKPRLGRGW